MEIWQAIILGIVEGLTEFLPISSTGHLAVTSQFIGLDPAAPDVIGFNAIIQTAAVVALLVYFAKDIWSILTGFFKGVFSPQHRQAFEYRFGWYIIIGSIPIVLAGLFAEDAVDSLFSSLWFVAIGMIGWSFVLWFAEYAATNQRSERQINVKDAVFVGVLQCASLFPGVSRSGAAMSAGMLRDLDRVSATRLAFFLGIPALTGAGVLKAKDAFDTDVGAVPVIVGMVVSAVVAYAAVAWLLRFVSRSSLMPFVWYRIGFGVILIGLLVTGVVQSN